MTLSKQDQALVQAQLDVEAVIRRQVDGIKARVLRGLRLVGGVVKARSESLSLHLSSIINLLLAGAFGKAISLVGEASFQSYIVSIMASNVEGILSMCVGTVGELFVSPGFFQ